MELHGSTEANLAAALRSANRLRGHPVHGDTLKFWSDLVRHARRELSSSVMLPSDTLIRLIAELEVTIEQQSG
jgi:hypothetical protein